ncbi:ATP-binding protein [Fibrobacterota bacterium]
MKSNPVTAILGPRQTGKSTLVRQFLKGRKDALILDLELPSDSRKLREPELFLKEHAQKLICVDEIQLQPDLFPVLRALVDQDRRPGRFLILGSASQNIIHQGSETLAGRIHHMELTPFLYREISSFKGNSNWDYKQLWWRGGFPSAFNAKNEEQSSSRRNDFIQTFLSRDIPQFGFSIPAPAMFRFWKLLSHFHGSVLNTSKLGQAIDVSHNTVRKYIDLLTHTFIVRVLPPLHINLKKRLVKAPKIYIRDTGLLHTLLEIDSWDNLFGHPVFGASWEGWCIEQIITALPKWAPYFYRTSSGEELDLVLERGKRKLAFEFKASSSPHLSKGFANTLDALKIEKTLVVCPIEEDGYPIKKSARICGIAECLNRLEEYA